MQLWTGSFTAVTRLYCAASQCVSGRKPYTQVRWIGRREETTKASDGQGPTLTSSATNDGSTRGVDSIRGQCPRGPPPAGRLPVTANRGPNARRRFAPTVDDLTGTPGRFQTGMRGQLNIGTDGRLKTGITGRFHRNTQRSTSAHRAGVIWIIRGPCVMVPPQQDSGILWEKPIGRTIRTNPYFRWLTYPI